MSKVSLSTGIVGDGMINNDHLNIVGTIVREHRYGDYPSRTLFIRNINSNVEDCKVVFGWRKNGFPIKSFSKENILLRKIDFLSHFPSFGTT